jgi:beta-phosphoglucomutase
MEANLIRAIVFDLDGVLWHSGPYHLVAYNRTLEPFGISIGDYGSIAGRRTDEVIAALLLEAGARHDPETVDALTQRKRRAFLDLLDADPPDLAGVRGLLERLSSRFALALCSSASAASVAHFASASGTAHLFSAILSGESVRKAKPDPAIYLRSTELLGVAAAQAVAVEDSADGVASARSAGLGVIGVQGTLRADELRQAGADAVIDELGSLEALIGECGGMHAAR